MKFENTEVFNFEGAFRGMRNPLNSWDKSDSVFHFVKYVENANSDINAESVDCCKLGENDLKLAQSLIRAGSEHRKFLRQIFVSVDITAPLYWFKEFDTYKVGTVANSTSTMHKLASTPITRDCFEMDDFEDFDIEANGLVYPNSYSWNTLIDECEYLRQKYNETKDKRYWKELVRRLPESWLQKRTITMNYENIYAMIRQRRNHKLSEWSKSFIEWAESLPYAKDLLLI